MFPYTRGQEDANTLFGLMKTAAGLPQLATAGAGLLGRAGSALKKWAPTWSGTKKFMIGEPKEFMNQLANRRFLSKGSLVRQGFEAPGMLSKAMFYGLPALDVVSTMRSDSPDKAKDIAGIIGGTAGSMAMFKPFGMLGAMAGGSIGGKLTSGLLNKGRQIAGAPIPEQAMNSQGAQGLAEHVPYQQMYPYASGASYLMGGGMG
jgi:hypothetical protein